MTTKHTPGPWAVQGLGPVRPEYPDWNHYAIRSPENICLAVVHEVDRYGADRALPDARLIAAAPELLKACKAVSEWHQHSVGCPASEIGAIGDSGCDCGLAAVRAAIAKAEGGAS